MIVIAIAGAGPQGVVPWRGRFARAPVVRVDSIAARLIGFLGGQLVQTWSGRLWFGGMWMVLLSWHAARLGPKWHYTGPGLLPQKIVLAGVTGPALIEKVMSPTDSVVAPLKANKTLLAKWR